MTTGNPWDDPTTHWDQTNDHNAWVRGDEVPPYRQCHHGNEAAGCPDCWAEVNPIPEREADPVTCPHGIPSWESCGRCWPW